MRGLGRTDGPHGACAGRDSSAGAAARRRRAIIVHLLSCKPRAGNKINSRMAFRLTRPRLRALVAKLAQPASQALARPLWLRSTTILKRRRRRRRCRPSASVSALKVQDRSSHHTRTGRAASKSLSQKFDLPFLPSFAALPFRSFRRLQSSNGYPLQLVVGDGH